MRDITVTFLGTASGGGPIDSRNCSSLVMDITGDGNNLWMVDCAEGTVRQLAQQPWGNKDFKYLRMSKISKVFVTHMHADHCMGVITLLRNVLGIPPSGPGATPKPTHPKIEVYGPVGIRSFIRTIFTLTHTRSADAYAAHELLMPGEQPSVPSGSHDRSVLHSSEVVGKDYRCDKEGFWRGFTHLGDRSSRQDKKFVVDAGSIIHRDPCIGYIIREVFEGHHEDHPSAVGRNIVILGDTSDPNALLPLIKNPSAATIASSQSTTAEAPSESTLLAQSTSDMSLSFPLDGITVSASTEQIITEYPSEQPLASGSTSTLTPPRVSLLIHEATDAYIPPHIDTHEKTGKHRNHEIVHKKAIDKGHSTPAMAGLFARNCGAERLVLNHIGARFPAVPPTTRGHISAFERFRIACIDEIERQATESWSHPNGARALAAYDFFRISIPPYPRPPRAAEQYTSIMEDSTTMTWGGGGMTMMSEEVEVVQTLAGGEEGTFGPGYGPGRKRYPGQRGRGNQQQIRQQHSQSRSREQQRQGGYGSNQRGGGGEGCQGNKRDHSQGDQRRSYASGSGRNGEGGRGDGGGHGRQGGNPDKRPKR